MFDPASTSARSSEVCGGSENGWTLLAVEEPDRQGDLDAEGESAARRLVAESVEEDERRESRQEGLKRVYTCEPHIAEETSNPLPTLPWACECAY